MIYCWDSLSCLHHPPLTFSSCRLFPSRSFCLPSLALSHSSMGLVLNPHLSLYHSLHLSLCTAAPMRQKEGERERKGAVERDREREREQEMSTFPHFCPFTVEENCFGFKWRYSSMSVPALTTERASRRPMPQLCLNISELKSWFDRTGQKKKIVVLSTSDKCGLCGEEVGWLKEQK